jgi:hypothetical protein
MVRIRKAQGGSGIGPHWWPQEDPVCDVPEELARDLLAHPEWGFSLEPDPVPELEAPAGDGEGDGPSAEDDNGKGDGDEGDHPEPAMKPAARKRKPAASA